MTSVDFSSEYELFKGLGALFIISMGATFVLIAVGVAVVSGEGSLIVETRSGVGDTSSIYLGVRTKTIEIRKKAKRVFLSMFK